MYVSKNRIVTAGIGAQTYNSNDLAQGWLNTSKLLKNKSEIKQCFFNQWRTGFLNEIKSCLGMLFTALEDKLYFKTVYHSFLLLSFLQKIILLLLFIPHTIFRIIRTIKR